jgi:hypothetical protein
LKMRSFAKLLAMPVIGLLAAHIGLGQLGRQDLSKKQLEDAYAKHDVKIRHILPPYSGPPLLLDLLHMRLEEGMCYPERHVAWESRFDGIMAAATTIADQGFSEPADATATTLVTIDTFGPSYSLPAKGCSDIVIAKPIAGRVCMPQSRRYVYTKFTLDVLKEFRKPADKKKQDPHEKRQVTAAQFGGSIRFPSGYLETFLLDRRGFIEIGKQYVLFMWKPISSDDTLVIAQAYLIENGIVFPVSTNGDAQTVYTNMPFPEFEAKVKNVVARNVDADVIPSGERLHVRSEKPPP